MRRAAFVAFVFFTGAVALAVAAPAARAATTFATQQTVLGEPAGYADPAPKGLATDAAGDVFMADAANDQVLELAAGATSPDVLPFTGLSSPSSLAADAAGDVVVLSGSQIVELPAGSTTQLVLPFAGLDYPTSVAVDGAGDVYVTDPYNGSGEVDELPAGASTSEVLPLSGISQPYDVAVDSSGDLYLYGTGAGYQPAIQEFAPGATTGTALPFAGLEYPSTSQYLAVDSSGDVYVSQPLGASASVVELAAGAPASTTVPLGTLANPSGVAVDSHGNLFVSESAQVIELASGATSPTITALTSLSSPEGVAVDGAGDLFVADNSDNRVLELKEGSTTPVTLPFAGLAEPTDVGVDAAGDVFVVGTLFNAQHQYMTGDEVVELPAGSSSQVTLPFGPLRGYDHITVDAAGDVYLADFFGNDILELAAGSDSPVMLPFTGLQLPFKAGVDAAGDVFALSNVSSQVYELAAGASDATLLPLNGAPTPEYMAVDAAGDLFLGSARGGQVVEYPAGSDIATTLPFTGISYTGPMAIDAAGDLFEAEPFQDRVVALQVTAPSAPVVTATAGSGQATLSWPAVPAGELTGYEVYEGTSPGGESATPVNAAPLLPTATGTTVTGLDNGSTYYFTVVATNDIAPSPSSTEVSVTPVPGPPVSLTLDGPPSVAAGSPAQYAVTGTDAEGNPTGDETAASSFSITPDPGGGGASQGAGCVGASCTATVAGTYTVAALTGAATGDASLTVTAGAPSAVAAASGGGQRTPAGAPFADPLVATVTDQYGNPVAGTAVTYKVTRGHATFANSTATITTGSGAGGLVSETLTAGAVPGPVTVTASIGTAAVATFDLTVTADAWTGPAASGAPHVAPGDAAGFYLGLVGGSGNHWRLFVTQAAHRPVGDYTGLVTVDKGRLSNVVGLQLEPGDAVHLSADGRSVTFAFSDAGYLDGLAFTTPDAATSLTLALSVDGVPATAGQVHLGPGDASAGAGGPLVIGR